MSSIDLDRTCDATANSGYSNRWTFSAWVKRGLIGTEQGLFANKRTDNNTNSRFRLRIKSTNRLCWEIKDSGGSDDSSFETNMLLRDTNAWYHIVFIYDSDNSTESNRMKCYVNGKDVRTELGGFSSINEVGSSFGTLWSSSVKNYIGVSHDNSGNPYRWDGLMSHVHFTYGYRYEASAFGETDSTTGEWKIKTTPSVTYGSQGFWLFKDNAAVTDQSGEGNNYTLNAGTLTKTEDNPSNIFCTLNPLATGNSKPTFSKGNNTVTANASGYQFSCGTIAVPLTGKWYWEVKANDNVNGSSTEYLIGAVLESRLEASGNFAEFAADGIAQYGSVSPGIGQNDIIGVSVDRTAATLKIYKNNSLILTKSSLPAELIYPMVTVYGSVSADANFGNGYFGGTAVSSAGTNASNNGIFEYDVIPSDANALSTKGLNL